MPEAAGVKVAVRVRPFNQRERDLNAKCCINMGGGNSTTICDLEGATADRVFTFDYSFWSHDRFKMDDNAYLIPEDDSSPYADQRHVFDTLGTEVLNNAWEGYHCCLFAYGQTGAGKSYSMVGFGPNKGIVPVTCEEIFNRIGKNGEKDKRFEVTVGMLEIYNEKIQDLLVSTNDRPKGGLDVRESKQLGIYVQDLTKRAVNTYEAIEALVDEGTSNRSIGSTLMNAVSSRAHTVLIIEFTQVTQFGGKEGRKLSVINLVDLAGSEKAEQTGATGDRLKEGCAINKSLSALGNVISALADKSSGKLKKGQLVPYRDSKLTRLLQNALGGSSKTIMICALSPASSNYEETLGTLRYADRAKKIKNNAEVNDDPTERLLKSLKEENERLKALLEGKADGGPSNMEASGMSEEDRKRVEDEHKKEIEEMEKALKEMEKSWEQRVQEGEQANTKSDIPNWATVPHLTNVNEDEVLTGKLNYALQGENEIWIGKKSKDFVPTIPLSGIDVSNRHVRIILCGGKSFLRSGDGFDRTFFNGEKIPKDGEQELVHGDRLVIGSQYAFLVIDPSVDNREATLQRNVHEQILEEVAEKQGDLQSNQKSLEELALEAQKMKEYQDKLAEMEEMKRKAEAEASAELKRKEEEFQARMKALEEKYNAEDLLKAEQEHQLQQARIAAEAEGARAAAEKAFREMEEEKLRQDQARQEQQKLNSKLAKFLPMIKEANLIAVELGKPYVLSPKLYVHVGANSKKKKTDLLIAVAYDGSHVYDWTTSVLDNRMFLIKDLLEHWIDVEDKDTFLAELPEEEDPYWDPVHGERLIGKADLYLKALTFQIENEAKAKIISAEGKQCGILEISINPVNHDSGPLDDESLVDDPKELIGTRMDLLLKVEKAVGLPNSLASDCRVQFRFYLEDEYRYVPPVDGHNRNPVFDYSQLITQNPVTEQFLEYLTNETVTFEVYGVDKGAEIVGAQRSQAPSRVTSRFTSAKHSPGTQTPNSVMPQDEDDKDEKSEEGPKKTLLDLPDTIHEEDSHKPIPFSVNSEAVAAGLRQQQSKDDQQQHSENDSKIAGGEETTTTQLVENKEPDIVVSVVEQETGKNDDKTEVCNCQKEVTNEGGKGNSKKKPLKNKKTKKSRACNIQ